MPNCASFLLGRQVRLFLHLRIIYYVHKALGSPLQINKCSELLDVPMKPHGSVHPEGDCQTSKKATSVYSLSFSLAIPDTGCSFFHGFM